jgi:hypothetical protein
MSQQYSTPPAGVGIQVVDSPDNRLVIAIPPGGKKARGLGCFGVFWLTIVGGIATGSISDVGIASANVRHRRNGQMRTSGAFSGQKGCMIKSSEFNMPLTMSSDAQFNEQVAGLARFQLRRLGVDLVND